MTYRERLAIEHPEAVDSDYVAGCLGCPSRYGYESAQFMCPLVKSASADSCIDCWNREMPNPEPRKLVVALDADDVLLGNLELATKLLEIDPESIETWDLKKCSGITPDQAEELYSLFRSEAFVRCQRPYPGAVEFVEALVAAGHDVLVASSVPPEVMAARGTAIRKFFPMLPEQNIMLGGKKTLLNVDVLVDDNPRNFSSNAKHCVMFAQRHNRNIDTAYPRTGSYDEILKLIDRWSREP